jgi:hypothetical protein
MSKRTPCRPCAERAKRLKDTADALHIPLGPVGRWLDRKAATLDGPDRSAAAFERKHGRPPRRSM